ncbi:HET-domain-containing protein [Xylaria cf. heliscus]|nr:HET-domain-containing protein [Xylaria cf. heliscus]
MFLRNTNQNTIMTVGILQEFGYPQLARTHKTIRLLQILSKPKELPRISLQEVNLSKPPPYKCLSYTWGDPIDRSLSSPGNYVQMSSERDHYVESEDRSIIKVTKNLVDALQQISRIQCSDAEEQISSWWIDAICINQEDPEERSGQVAVMDEIYQKAESVLIWLGKEDEHTGVAIKVLKSLANVSPDLAKTARSFRSFNMDSFGILDSLSGLCEDLGIKDVQLQDLPHYAAFLERKWFTRMWVVQESFFSAATTVFCGEREIKWEMIQQSSRVLDQTGMDTLLKAYVGYSTQYSLDVDAIRLPDNRLSNQLIFGSLQRGTAEAIGLGQLLYYSRFFEASDPRDKVYAVLGLWRYTRSNEAGNVDIWPDYKKDVADVYVEATIAAIHESGNLDVLSLVEGTSSERAIELPSWIPDYSQGPQVYPLVQPSKPTSGSRGLHANFETLRDSRTRNLPVQGFQVDIIEDVAPTYGAIMNEFQLGSLLSLLLAYPQIQYPTGISPCTAFWRTLIKDTFRGTQASIEAQHAFPAFVMQRDREIRQQIANLDDCNETQLAEDFRAFLRDTEAVIEHLSSTYGEDKAIPALEQIEDMIRVEEQEEGSPAEQKLESDRKDIEESFRVAYFRRRLFRTAGGYFGIASQSVMPGDTVWVLSGARVPFVLSAVDAEGESWRLVSEAYVHGIMHCNASADEASLRHISLV